MRVVVIEPPAPIVTPSQIPGKHAGDDALVTSMIAAAQADIDGPTGWLGRSLGPQVIEASGWWGCERIRLPFPPVIEVLTIKVEGEDGQDLIVDPDEYRVSNGELVAAAGAEWVRRPDQRILYRVGYVEPPANAVAAVILMTAGLLSATEANGGLRSFEVNGAFTKQFNSPEAIARVRSAAVEALLAPLRVFA